MPTGSEKSETTPELFVSQNSKETQKFFAEHKSSSLVQAVNEGRTDVLQTAAVFGRHSADVGFSGKIRKRVTDRVNPDIITEVESAQISTRSAIEIALCKAAQNGDIQSLKMLIAKIDDIDAKNGASGEAENQETKRLTLFVALNNKRETAVKELISLGSDPNATHDGYSTLHYAAGGNMTETIILLLGLGVDMEAQSSSGDTPLTFAIKNDRVESAEILLHAGSNSNTSSLTPPALAVEYGATQTLKMLLDRDTEGYNNSLLLHRAAHIGNIETVQVLLDAKLDTEEKDTRGMTPLLIAANLGEADIVRLLLRKGANIKAKTPDGYGVEELVTDKIIKGTMPPMRHNEIPLPNPNNDEAIESLNRQINEKNAKMEEGRRQIREMLKNPKTVLDPENAEALDSKECYIVM